jgi:hypothetical protein
MWRIFAGWNVTSAGATSRAVADYLCPMTALLRLFDSRMPSMREQWRVDAFDY